MRDFIEEQLSRFHKAVEMIGGVFDDCTIDIAASQEELDHIESMLGHTLPEDLKDFASKVSRRISFSWNLPDNFELPDSLNEIFGGGLDYDISKIPEHETGRAGWQSECFPNAQDPYDAIWHDKIGFHHVPNGDYLGFDSSGRVVYLSHDDGEGHGYIMASSFSDLMRRWVPLGCPGPEDWQWMPFVSGRDSGIIPDCDTAREWLQVIQKKP